MMPTYTLEQSVRPAPQGLDGWMPNVLRVLRTFEVASYMPHSLPDAKSASFGSGSGAGDLGVVIFLAAVSASGASAAATDCLVYTQLGSA